MRVSTPKGIGDLTVQRHDIVVEVRDKTLKRVGVIDPDELQLDLHDMYANVGSWDLTLPAEHPMALELSKPGSGIVVSLYGETLASGPTTKPEIQQTPEEWTGMVTFEGLTDSVVLLDALAYPTPSATAENQTTAHDERTGPCETLMHEYVKANIGPDAIPSRRNQRIVMGADGGRGPVVTRRPRFRGLGGLLAELAVLGNLGFRVRQVGNNLEFQTYPIRDRSGFVRLDLRNGTLSGNRLSVEVPEATVAIVGGAGVAEDRLFATVSTTDSEQAQADWGRRIETYLDHRNADMDQVEELVQVGAEKLTEIGFTKIHSQIVPNEDNDMGFGRDWRLGDKIAVVTGSTEHKITATGLVVKVDADGLRVGISLGDDVMTGRANAIEQRIKDIELSLPNFPPVDWSGLGNLGEMQAQLDDIQLQLGDLDLEGLGDIDLRLDDLELQLAGLDLAGINSDIADLQDAMDSVGLGWDPGEPPVNIIPSTRFIDTAAGYPRLAAHSEPSGDAWEITRPRAVDVDSTSKLVLADPLPYLELSDFTLFNGAQFATEHPNSGDPITPKIDPGQWQFIVKIPNAQIPQTGTRKFLEVEWNMVGAEFKMFVQEALKPGPSWALSIDGNTVWSCRWERTFSFMLDGSPVFTVGPNSPNADQPGQVYVVPNDDDMGTYSVKATWTLVAEGAWQGPDDPPWTSPGSSFSSYSSDDVMWSARPLNYIPANDPEADKGFKGEGNTIRGALGAPAGARFYYNLDTGETTSTMGDPLEVTPGMQYKLGGRGGNGVGEVDVVVLGDNGSSTPVEVYRRSGIGGWGAYISNLFNTFQMPENITGVWVAVELVDSPTRTAPGAGIHFLTLTPMSNVAPLTFLNKDTFKMFKMGDVFDDFDNFDFEVNSVDKAAKIVIDRAQFLFDATGFGVEFP